MIFLEGPRSKLFAALRDVSLKKFMEIDMATGSITFEDTLYVPADVFEFEHFRAWAHSDDFPDTGKIAFIGGDIEIDISPEELNSHNYVKRDISTDLNQFIRQTGLGNLLVDGALLVNEAAGLATEPDLTFCL